MFLPLTHTKPTNPTGMAVEFHDEPGNLYFVDSIGFWALSFLDYIGQDGTPYWCNAFHGDVLTIGAVGAVMETIVARGDTVMIQAGMPS